MEFSHLPDDVLFYILQYLNTTDRITLALTFPRLRQLCHDEQVFKKVDLSSGYNSTQRGAIKEFFKDKLLAHGITELNLNYCTDANLEEFVIASCPQLEALHVVDCGMSIRSLNRILQHAHKLTTLSWSMVMLSPEDTEFVAQNVESNDIIWLENIKNLWIETAFSKLHMEILRYLLLCCCKCIENIRITFSDEPQLPYDEWDNAFFPHNPSSSEIDSLQHLHSLVVDSHCLEQSSDSVMSLLSDIVTSLERKKPCGSKWIQFILPPPLESYILSRSYGIEKFCFELCFNSPELPDDDFWDFFE